MEIFSLLIYKADHRTVILFRRGKISTITFLTWCTLQTCVTLSSNMIVQELIYFIFTQRRYGFSFSLAWTMIFFNIFKWRSVQIFLRLLIHFKQFLLTIKTQIPSSSTNYNLDSAANFHDHLHATEMGFHTGLPWYLHPWSYHLHNIFQGFQ